MNVGMTRARRKLVRVGDSLDHYKCALALCTFGLRVNGALSFTI